MLTACVDTTIATGKQRQTLCHDVSVLFILLLRHALLSYFSDDCRFLNTLPHKLFSGVTKLHLPFFKLTNVTFYCNNFLLVYSVYLAQIFNLWHLKVHLKIKQAIYKKPIIRNN